jgi:poly(A) polymerase
LVSEAAIRTLYGLKKGGYEAYLVGGGVRDLLLGREPKDFDIATNAKPEEIRRLFRSCMIIGRRFRLAHVRFGREVIEVATFRAGADESGVDGGEQVTENGRLVRDNVYGSLEQDARRRDFTLNALYYNIRDFSVVDYADGMADLEAGLLRLIGDPEQRYREDPVRMLRAVRFAAKLGFRIEAATEAPISSMGGLLGDIPPSRLYEEVVKIFHNGEAVQGFELLRHYGLFGVLFPLTEAALSLEENAYPITLVTEALVNTDRRIAEGKPVTPAFLFAALLWEPVRLAAMGFEDQGAAPVEALHLAASDIFARQVQSVALPKRFAIQTREIWALQPRLRSIKGKRPERLLSHPRFRAAYDFLCLRASCGEEDEALAQWWTDYQESKGPVERRPEPARRPRRRRRKQSKTSG